MPEFRLKNLLKNKTLDIKDASPWAKELFFFSEKNRYQPVEFAIVCALIFSALINFWLFFDGAAKDETARLLLIGIMAVSTLTGFWVFTLSFSLMNALILKKTIFHKHLPCSSCGKDPETAIDGSKTDMSALSFYVDGTCPHCGTKLLQLDNMVDNAISQARRYDIKTVCNLNYSQFENACSQEDNDSEPLDIEMAALIPHKTQNPKTDVIIAKLFQEDCKQFGLGVADERKIHPSTEDSPKTVAIFTIAWILFVAIGKMIAIQYLYASPDDEIGVFVEQQFDKAVQADPVSANSYKHQMLYSVAQEGIREIIDGREVKFKYDFDDKVMKRQIHIDALIPVRTEQNKPNWERLVKESGKTTFCRVLSKTNIIIRNEVVFFDGRVEMLNIDYHDCLPSPKP